MWPCFTSSYTLQIRMTTSNSLLPTTPHHQLRRRFSRSLLSPAMASTTSFSGVALPHSVPMPRRRNDAVLAQFQLSLSSPAKPTSLKALNSFPLNKREAFKNGFTKTRRNPKQFSIRCAAASGKVTLLDTTHIYDRTCAFIIIVITSS